MCISSLLRTFGLQSTRFAARWAAPLRNFLRRPAAIRRAASALLTLGFLWVAPGAAAIAGETAPAVLEIVNETTRAVLRCQLVLAHFMTRDLAPTAPGQALEIDLLRETASGTLLRSDLDGRLVPVENVLCGADDDWMATRNDVDLTGLRAGSLRRLRIVCVEGNGMSCSAAGAVD